MSLPKIVNDQISLHQRTKLGQIKSPSIKPILFADTNTVLDDTNKNIQWSKKYYILNRSNLDTLTRETFNNTDELIRLTVLPSTSDGSLIDGNLPQHTNIEYSVDVFTNTQKSFSFNIDMQNNTMCNVYRRDLINGTYVNILMASFNGSSRVSVGFKEKTWTTFIIYLYNAIENNSIRMFSNLSSYVDAWRFPDTEPPQIPIWHSTPIINQTNSLTGVNSNILQWVLPNSPDWYGNNIYLTNEETTLYDVEEQSQDHTLNAFYINTANVNASNEFPAGSDIYPNSDYAYHPVQTIVVNKNMISNSMFATSGASSWSGWTKVKPTTASIVPDRGNFYTNGVSIQGYKPYSAAATSVSIRRSSFITINKDIKYNALVTYKHLSTVKSGCLELKYWRSDLITPCSTPSQLYFFGSATNWKTNFITIHNHTAPYYERPYNIITANSFRMPSDAVYIQPILHFGYKSTSAFKMNYDSIKIGEYNSTDQFTSNTVDRMAVVVQENLLIPDTPYCNMHIRYNGNANDANRGVTGTLVSTAWYVSNNYFAKFNTAIALSSRGRNYIRNGHFSSSVSQGTAYWTSNSLYLFATSHTALFGTRSLKIGATTTTQSVSQVLIQPLTSNLAKRFSMYAKPVNSDGFVLRGKLSGVTKWEYKTKFHTTNWSRYTYIAGSADTIHIYPSYGSPTDNNSILIDGIMYCSSVSFYNLYYDPYISGTFFKNKNSVEYTLNTVNASHCSLSFYYSPQFYSSSQAAGILSFYSAGGSIYHRIYYSNTLRKFIYSNNESTSVTLYSSVIDFKPNDRLHLGFTLDKNNVNLYVNGIKYSSPKFFSEINDNSDVILRIGNDSNQTVGADGYFEELKFENCTYDESHMLKDSIAEKVSIYG